MTEPGDLVVDIFAGSNTTGAAAQEAGRRWIAFEQERQYLAASAFRFLDKDMGADPAKAVYQALTTQAGQVCLPAPAQTRLSVLLEDAPVYQETADGYSETALLEGG